MNIPWWGYVVGAGLAWGTYVPLIFFGGQMLSPLSPQGTPIGVGGRLASILCVGVAYFGLAVVIPVILMAIREDAQADWKGVGLTFSALAGSSTSSTGTGGIRCHGHWSNSARKHFVKSRAFGMPP